MPINPNNLAATATMTFNDEFNSLNLWNGTAGTWSTTYIFADPNGNGSSLPSNGEQEWYINNLDPQTASIKPWTVSNGVLNLTAAPAPASIQPLINNYKYTSGMLETSHSFNQTYGYFEMRAKLPAGQGLWPAFWLLPQSGAWPPELDVMEMLGNNPSKYFTTAHSTTLPGGQSGFGSTVVDTSAAFHNYGMDWEKDYTTWYFDGRPVYRVPTPSDMNQPMYMLLNLAVGGYWPGNADATTHFPANMQIDYVRAYKALPNAPVVSSPNTASPLDGSHNALAAAGSAAPLTSGGAVTSAVMLSNGEVATVGATSAGAGVANLFNSQGVAQGGTVALNASASGLHPQITAMAGGMFKVTYTGANAPAQTEIYGASGARLSYVDGFSTGHPLFAALNDGGYVQSNDGWNGRFNITDPTGTIDWFNLPADSAGKAMQPNAIQTLADGGFAFSYANSAQVDRYNFSGGVHTTMQLASAPTAAGPALAAFGDGVTEAAWVNGSGAVSVQGFGPVGASIGSAVTLASGVDATAQVKILATGVSDHAVTLWSSGGAIYGAGFDGSAATAATKLAPGALNAAQSTVLSDGKVALSWLQTDSGVQHLWSEVLDPTTMKAVTHDLGAADGSAHLVALKDGGFAESWKAGGVTQAVAYAGTGKYGAVAKISGDFVGANAAGQAVAVSVDASGHATVQTFGVNSGSAASAATTTADLLGNSKSDALLVNTNGQVVVGEVGANGKMAYTAVSALGSDWTFHGSGDYLGLGRDQYLIENASGAVVAGAVQNGKAQYVQLGTLAAGSQIHGSGDFLGDGAAGFLVQTKAGAVQVGEAGVNGQATYKQVGALGSEWSFQGSGDYLGKGHDQFLIENTNGALVVGNVQNGQTTYQKVAGVGSEWKVLGSGDYLADGKQGFLMQNTSGAVVVGEVGADGKAAYTAVGGLGSEWTYKGSGDYLGNGHAQYLIQNSHGAVVAADASSGHAAYTAVGGLGSEWSLHL